MQFDLQKAIETIKNDPDFLKLTNVQEKGNGHSGETTYEHSLQTYDVARNLVKGNQITNTEAKRKFKEFINQEVGEIKKRDLLQIVALVHDSGKMVVFDKKRPLFELTRSGNKEAPEHGYWGSLIIVGILKRTGISSDALVYIANCIRLHLAGWQCWSMQVNAKERLWQLKLRTEGFHAEVMFNIYCDLYYNSLFQDKIHLPIELLNDSEAYESMKYETMD